MMWLKTGTLVVLLPFLFACQFVADSNNPMEESEILATTQQFPGPMPNYTGIPTGPDLQLPGTVDSSFANYGYLPLDFGVTTMEFPTSFAIDSSDRIIIAGTSDCDITHSSSFLIARYTVDGSPDNAFGVNGRVSFAPAPSPLPPGGVTYERNTAYGVAVRDDGEIVVAGYSTNIMPTPTPTETPKKAVLFPVSDIGKIGTAHFDITYNLFYNPISIGTTNPDTLVLAQLPSTLQISKFSSTSNTQQPIYVPSQLSSPINMVAQPNGSILINGVYNGNSNFGVARLTADTNALDTSFGTLNGGSRNGIAYTQYADTSTSTPHALALQSDGNILVAGSRNFTSGTETMMEGMIVRFTADGSIDTSFGGNNDGRALLKKPARGIAVQSDSKILVTMGGGGTARLNSDGTLDTNFGEGGYSAVGGTMIRLQSDGKIIVGIIHMGGGFFQRLWP